MWGSHRVCVTVPFLHPCRLLWMCTRVPCSWTGSGVQQWAEQAQPPSAMEVNVALLWTLTTKGLRRLGQAQVGCAWEVGIFLGNALSLHFPWKPRAGQFSARSQSSR